MDNEVFEDEETLAIEKALNEGISVEIVRQPAKGELRVIREEGEEREEDSEGEEQS